MKTSYFQNKAINPDVHVVVQISLGHPQWGTQPEIISDMLAPPSDVLELAKRGASLTEYTRAYAAYLDSIGVDRIRDELEQIKQMAGGREPLLCCFESLKKRGQYCHRRIFAWWWHKHTGEVISEL